MALLAGRPGPQPPVAGHVILGRHLGQAPLLPVHPFHPLLRRQRPRPGVAGLAGRGLRPGPHQRLPALPLPLHLHPALRVRLGRGQRGGGGRLRLELGQRVGGGHGVPVADERGRRQLRDPQRGRQGQGRARLEQRGRGELGRLRQRQRLGGEHVERPGEGGRTEGHDGGEGGQLVAVREHGARGRVAVAREGHLTLQHPRLQHQGRRAAGRVAIL